MEARAGLALAGLCLARAASADPPAAAYPVERVDRPILLYDGMTEADVGLDLPVDPYDVPDGSGGTTTTRSRFGAVANLSASARHSFGAAELSLFGGGNLTRPPEVSSYRYVGASVKIPAAWRISDVALDVVYDPAQQDLHHYVAGSAYFEAKARAKTRAFALFGSLGTTAQDLSSRTGNGRELALVASATAEVQLAHRVALSGYTTLGVPLISTGKYAGALLGSLGTQLEVTIAQCDLYVDASSPGAVRDGWLYDVGFGVRARFGR